MATDDPPRSVRINTDPSSGHGHRYREIVRASEALRTSGKTKTVVAACEHSARDVEAKREAVEYLAGILAPDELATVLEKLSTPRVPLAAELSIEAGGYSIEVEVGEVQS